MICRVSGLPEEGAETKHRTREEMMAAMRDRFGSGAYVKWNPDRTVGAVMKDFDRVGTVTVSSREWSDE